VNFVFMSEFVLFLDESVVGFKAGGVDIGVEGRAELGLRSDELSLEGGLAGGQFGVESAT
jgi:hypothetical protein